MNFMFGAFLTGIYTVLSVSVNYLDKQVEGKIPPVRGEDWQPFFTYRNSLMQGETDWNPITLRQAAQKRYGKRGRADSEY